MIVSDWCERFYRAYEAWAMMRVPWVDNLAPEMIAGLPDSEGWINWRLVKSEKPVAAEFSKFESEYDCRFPSSFRAWFGFYYTLDLDCALVRLPECRPENPLKTLRWSAADQMDYRHIRSQGLLPFGDETMMDAGPLCFDTRAASPNSEWPIVYWDHEWYGTDKATGPIIFSSFQKMIECITDNLEIAVKTKPVKWNGRWALDRLFALDPAGAGKTGRDYWSTYLTDD